MNLFRAPHPKGEPTYMSKYQELCEAFLRSRTQQQIYIRACRDFVNFISVGTSQYFDSPPGTIGFNPLMLDNEGYIHTTIKIFLTSGNFKKEIEYPIKIRRIKDEDFYVDVSSKQGEM